MSQRLFSRSFLLAWAIFASGGAVSGWAADPPEAETGEETPIARRHVLIVMGLAGDVEHAHRFDESAQQWRNGLTELLGVPSENIIVMRGWGNPESAQFATAENIRQAIAKMVDEVQADDGFWLILAGHGSHDRRHTWFHLPGPDLHAADWAALLQPVRAREQVFLLTQSSSGGFLQAMSRRGRVVITATDSAEERNETRFPHALADAFEHDCELAQSESGKASGGNLVQLLQRISEAVDHSFTADQLVPTEHALLDDNGDGIGTEAQQLANSPTVTAETSAEPLLDGNLAAQIAVPRFVERGEAIEQAEVSVNGFETKTSANQAPSDGAATIAEETTNE